MRYSLLYFFDYILLSLLSVLSYWNSHQRGVGTSELLFCATSLLSYFSAFFPHIAFLREFIGLAIQLSNLLYRSVHSLIQLTCGVFLEFKISCGFLFPGCHLLTGV